MKKRILIVAAHPDDEVLGCAGTIARLTEEGHEAYTLILGEGITSRDASRARDKRSGEIEALKDRAREANKTIGVKEVFLRDFPDNRFDEAALLDIVKAVEETVVAIKPEVIFTHHRNDLNIDHRITYNAVLTACRPACAPRVREIYSFEVPSSTEWNYPYVFNPTRFINIARSMKRKLSALRRYDSELKRYPHPRSMEGVKLNAAYWGMRTGLKYAEAFEVIRSVE
jgi:LmbE family N-acetylglucosaminyl deacetylase